MTEDIPEDTILLLAVVGEGGKGVNITTYSCMDQESYEALSAILLRSALKGGCKLKNILGKLSDVDLASIGAVPQPLVIA